MMNSAKCKITMSSYDAAAGFLNGMRVDAGLFTEPDRSEEWLIAVENLQHVLLALEQEYVGNSSAPRPFWLSDEPLGVESAEFIQLALKVPHLLKQLQPTQKLAFFANLIGMIASACQDVAEGAMRGGRPAIAKT